MFIKVGKIVGVWGVKGWLKIHSYTHNRSDIADYPAWYLSKTLPPRSTPYSVRACKTQGRGMAAQLEGIENRDAAEAYLGFGIYIAESDLPVLADGEYYWRHLVGLDVVNLHGQRLGKVTSLIETGANDVLVVARQLQSDDAQKPTSGEALIPYVSEVVKKVDLDMQLITVEWELSYLDD